MWKWIKSLFQGPTPEELKKHYDNGRFTARVMIIKADDKSKCADDLYYMCEAAINYSKIDHEFDRGVTDQLAQWGYNCPYTNGHF